MAKKAPISNVLQELIADGVVRGEGRGVRRGGLRAGRAAVRFDQQHGLLLCGFFDGVDERRTVVEAFQVRPDLLDRRLRRVVLQSVQLVHVARVAEGNELRDPAFIRATRQLVQ